MSRQPDIGIQFRLPAIDELRQGYAALPKTLSAVTLAAACRRALQPSLAVLKANSPKGPTGNLQRAVTIKSVKYTKTRTGAAIVGYKKAGSGKSKSAGGGRVRRGSDRAFHQFWIEFGTKERRIKVPSSRGFFIASSFDSLGPFRLRSTSKHAKRSRRFQKQAQRLIGRAAKQKFQDEASAASMMREKARGLMADAGYAAMASRRVQTSPPYPKAFFTARPFGTPLVLPAMLPQHPIRETWEQIRPAATGRLEAEMRKGLVSAQNQLKIRAAKGAAKKQAAIEAAAARKAMGGNPATPF